MTPLELRPCHRRVSELRRLLAERQKIGEDMAEEVERLCRRIAKNIDSRDVVISVEEVQDLFKRTGRRP